LSGGGATLPSSSAGGGSALGALAESEVSALLGFDPWAALVGLFERDTEREHD